MNRAHRLFTRLLVADAAVAALALGCTGTSKSPERAAPVPVVLVSLDTVRADRLNCYGYNARKVTPALDALAADGILFENHVSAAPWTPPAHASLLTSLWPSSHGVTDSFREYKESKRQPRVFHAMAASKTTLAEVLRTAGYATAAFTGGMTLDARLGFGQGFDTFSTTMFKLQRKNVGEMLSWVAEKRGGPFLLFFHTFEAHAPYLGTRFLSEVLPPKHAAELTAVVERYAERLATGGRTPTSFVKMLRRHQAYRRDVTEALYVGSIAEADRWLGVLIEDLRRRGLYDRALVVVTSDHGEEFGERSPEIFYDAHGHNLHREMVRTPLILKVPGRWSAGTRVSALTRTVDVMPTVLDILSLKGPKEMQGESLRPLWEGGETRPRVAFIEALGQIAEQKAIQTADRKYVVGIGPESVASHGRAHMPADLTSRSLFDLGRDPNEEVDLLTGKPSASDRRLAEELERALRAHLAAQRADSEAVELDAEELERLRALGYVQ
jgi:arylsulfatase A-like enzyme